MAEEDRKLEMEERDRARRSSEMRREGELLLAREDEAAGWCQARLRGGGELRGEESDEGEVADEKYRDPVG